MAYDEELADRVRKAAGSRAGLSEKAMFGGLAFLQGGKVFCGVLKDDLMVRVGPEAYEPTLREPHVRPMDFTGRPMKGYVFVGPDGCRTEASVAAWIERGAGFVVTLAKEKPAAKKTSTSTKPTATKTEKRASGRAATPGRARRRTDRPK